MRLNTKKLQEIMNEKNLTQEKLCSLTGLDKCSVEWIFDNGFVSEDAMERIAGAAGIEVGVILLPEITGNIENTIEFTKDSERATVTFSQGRYKTRIKKLAKSHPEECRIVAENQDGSLCAHIPVEWVKISPPKAVSELQRETSRRNISKVLSSGHENSLNSI